MIRRETVVALTLCTAAASALAFLSACGGSTPAEPTGPVAVSTPAPTATPHPSTLGCGQPVMPDLHNTCPKLDPQFANDVTDAIQTVIRTRPELFDFDDTLNSGPPFYKVKDHRGYTGAVINVLRTKGFCATDETEEIAVKKTNERNEQYNIWTSFGYVRMPPGAYMTTCFPAQF